VTPCRLLRRLTRRLAREEGGWALATTIIVTTLMVSTGLATAAWVDGQTRSSTRERLNESSFNLAEGVFNAEVYVLSHAWPGSDPATHPLSPNYPTSCTPSSTSSLCPDSASLGGDYSTADYGSAPVWTTEIHDNDTGDTPNFYNDTSPSPMRWDSNGDDKLWVRAQATVRGRTRVIVGLVQVQQQTEDLPSSVIVAGSMSTSNNGNKEIVCTRLPNDPSGNSCDSSSQLAGPPLLRCTGGVGTSCQDFRDGQLAPDGAVTGYTGTGLSADAIDRFRQRAIAEGTYFATGCPPSPAGSLVFVENADCSYTNSTPGPWNSANNPGMLLINSGTISFTGNQTFYGLIYGANAQNTTGSVVTLGGTSAVQGSIQVGGQGTVTAGSSKLNLLFDPYVFTAAKSFGAVTIVQNKWREIAPRPGT
jgi:hypothetical protein